MKIILLGNAGAGKSTMAKQLIDKADDDSITCLSLDEIAWNEGPVRKPMSESLALLNIFLAKNKQWIIEGCYGDLVEATLPHCEELRFLNPGVEACVTHCYQRPWEPEKFSSPEEQQATLNYLVNWVKKYESRDDEYGLKYHRRIFAEFSGKKREYHSVENYAEG